MLIACASKPASLCFGDCLRTLGCSEEESTHRWPEQPINNLERAIAPSGKALWCRYASGSDVWLGAKLGGLAAGAPRIDQPANLMHGIQTTADHEFKRGDATEDLVPILKFDPMIGQIVSVANVQPLVDPDEITDLEQAFLGEELRSWVEPELFDWYFSSERKQF
jgi:hypothetical protein